MGRIETYDTNEERDRFSGPYRLLFCLENTSCLPKKKTQQDLAPSLSTQPHFATFIRVDKLYLNQRLMR